MMDRINRAVLRWIRHRAGPAVDTVVFDSLRLTGRSGSKDAWSMPWRQVKRVSAYMNEELIGNTLVLVFESDSEQRAVAEDQSGWSELTTRLPELLPGAAAYASWAPWVVAHPPSDAFVVFNCDGAEQDKAP